MNPADAILVDPVIAQRDDLSPSYRELSLLLRKSFGRDIDSFGLEEIELARIVFAQVALMAGAALAGDSELFAGADRLWRDMQDRIGEQERVLVELEKALAAQLPVLEPQLAHGDEPHVVLRTERERKASTAWSPSSRSSIPQRRPLTYSLS